MGFIDRVVIRHRACANGVPRVFFCLFVVFSRMLFFCVLTVGMFTVSMFTVGMFTVGMFPFGMFTVGLVLFVLRPPSFSAVDTTCVPF